MTRPLRFAMVALVLVNLGFVHITEAARLLWMLPLIGLTVASPWLVRFGRHLAYRSFWNLGVMGAFALLVHHFTSRGSAYLLEDGLLLAALCQVHLLNNAGARQKPDLLFFNSFLIAVVTSFLSLDVAYSLMFALYVPVLVVALQLLALHRAGVAAEPGLAVRVVRQGLLRGAVVLGVTLAAFALMPRDFRRKGVLAGSWTLKPPGGMEVGFNPTIDFRRKGRVTSSDRVVMRIRRVSGNPADVPSYWRGAALVHFDGQQWRPGGRHDARSSELWRRRSRAEMRRLAGRVDAEVEVTIADRRSTSLFAPLRASRLRAPSVYAVRGYPDATLRATLPGQYKSYRVAIANRVRPFGRSGPARPVGRLRTLLDVGPGLPRAGRDLADRLAAGLEPGASQHRLVETMRAHLFQNYRYLPPGSDDGAHDLRDFFGGKPAGHCEIFATALTLMLRRAGVPARVVTGYCSTEWDDEQTVLTVRARHAHAWVEALDPKARWYTVDATPAADEGAMTAGAGWIERARAWAAGLWSRVVGFNSSTQAKVGAWLGALPGRVLRALRASPLTTALGLAALVALLVVARRARRRGIPAATRRYRAALRRFGVALRPGETPRMLLARLQLADSQRTVLEAVTAEHEQGRYASARVR